MIIDTGSDLHRLARELLPRDGDSSPLVVIAMTGDMELYFVEAVAEHYGGTLDEHHPEILAAVDVDFVRYFAVAHRSPEAYPEAIDLEQTRRLRDTAQERGLHLLGELHLDATGWCSTGPMSFFKQYLDDDLPRVVVRRPRHFATTRLAGGREIEPPDGSFYERFCYEVEEQDDRPEVALVPRS